MRVKGICVAVALSVWSIAAQAAGIGDLMQAMRFAEISEILAEEGQGHGQSLQEQMFPQRDTEEWTGVVAAIYQPDRLRAEMMASLQAELPAEDLPEILAFYRGETGEMFVRLEEEARRAMMDDDADAAARDSYAQMVADDAPRLKLLQRFIEANSLVDLNVANTLNSNFAFYLGMAEGGGPGAQISEADLLREVWQQEPEIRSDTEEWIYAYLALAYTPASDAQIEAYITFSESRAGRRLNSALFVGFDDSFRRVSREMGFAAARFLAAGEDI